jgi:hypothetical protein
MPSKIPTFEDVKKNLKNVHFYYPSQETEAKRMEFHVDVFGNIDEYQVLIDVRPSSSKEDAICVAFARETNGELRRGPDGSITYIGYAPM